MEVKNQVNSCRFPEIFKFEPIVDANKKLWGFEVLLSINVPNPYIFAVPNPVLELYLFETFVRCFLPEFRQFRFTFNLSVFAVVIGASTLEKVLASFPNLYVEVTESAFLPSNDSCEWFRLFRSTVSSFPGRFLLDDYMEGKTTFLLGSLKQYWYGVKVSSHLLRQIQLPDAHEIRIIAEKVETEEEFFSLKSQNRACLFQGFLFSHREYRLFVTETGKNGN